MTTLSSRPAPYSRPVSTPRSTLAPRAVTVHAPASPDQLSPQREGYHAGTLGLLMAVGIGFLLASNQGSREQIQKLANQIGQKLNLTPTEEAKAKDQKKTPPPVSEQEIEAAKTPEAVASVVKQLSPAQRHAFEKALAPSSSPSPSSQPV